MQLLLVLLAAFLAACAPKEPDFTGGPDLRFSWEGDVKGEHVVVEVQKRLKAYGVDAAVDLPAERVLRVRLTRGEWDKAPGVVATVTLRGTVEFRRTVEPFQTDHYDAYAERLPEAEDAVEPVTIPAKDLLGEDRERFPHGLRWVAVAEGARLDEDRTARGRWVLLRLDPYEVTHADLFNVFPGWTQDDLDPEWAVYFSVKKLAQERMARLTEFEENAFLAIVLDDRVERAPLLRDTLRDQGQISGVFDEYLARALAAALAAGPLPADLTYIRN